MTKFAIFPRLLHDMYNNLTKFPSFYRDFFVEVCTYLEALTKFMFFKPLTKFVFFTAIIWLNSCCLPRSFNRIGVSLVLSLNKIKKFHEIYFLLRPINETNFFTWSFVDIRDNCARLIGKVSDTFLWPQLTKFGAHFH